MEVKRICSKCGELNKIGADDIINYYAYDELKECYIIMCYDCKRCKEHNALQIDNMRTRHECKKAKSILYKTMKNKNSMSDEELTKCRKEFDKVNRKLDEKRNELKELNRGKNFYDEDGNIFIKRLTFGEDGDIIDNNL